MPSACDAIGRWIEASLETEESETMTNDDIIHHFRERVAIMRIEGVKAEEAMQTAYRETRDVITATVIPQIKVLVDEYDKLQKEIGRAHV